MRRPPLVRHAATLALGLGTIAASAPPLQAQFQQGRGYHFTMTDGDGDRNEGVMYVAGDRVRIEMRGGKHRGGQHDYILVTDGGRTMTVVHPDEETYSVMDARKFERIVGTAMKAVDAIVTMELADASVKGEHLGDGGTVAGVPTQQYRLTQEYAVRVGAFGQTELERHRVVTDYWVSPDPKVPRNPIVELVMNAPTALAQADADYVRRREQTRKDLFSSAPLRIVSRSVDLQDNDEEVFEYEVTEIVPTRIDVRALRVPDGYRRTDSDIMNVGW